MSLPCHVPTTLVAPTVGQAWPGRSGACGSVGTSLRHWAPILALRGAAVARGVPVAICPTPALRRRAWSESGLQWLTWCQGSRAPSARRGPRAVGVPVPWPCRPACWAGLVGPQEAGVGALTPHCTCNFEKLSPLPGSFCGQSRVPHSLGPEGLAGQLPHAQPCLPGHGASQSPLGSRACASQGAVPGRASQEGRLRQD